MISYRLKKIFDSQFDCIEPNMIYNRFDLFSCSASDYSIDLWKFEHKGKIFFFEVRVNQSVAELGIQCMDFTQEDLTKVIGGLFKKYKNVLEIRYNNAYSAIGNHIQHNNFRIVFPGSKNDLQSRLSRKNRYNLKREKRLLKERFGEYEINHFLVGSVQSNSIVKKYFQLKKESHDVEYKMTPEEYCKNYHVTDLYCLTISETNEILAVIISCEQCPYVYLENLTYNQEYSKFSPGTILYDEFLSILVEKGKKGIFLLGGDYAYKKHYGSIEECVYDGVINRKPNMYKRIRHKIGSIIKNMV